MQAREFRRRRHHRSMPELRSCSIVCYVIGLAKITLPRKAGAPLNALAAVRLISEPIRNVTIQLTDT